MEEDWCKSMQIVRDVVSYWKACFGHPFRPGVTDPLPGILNICKQVTSISIITKRYGATKDKVKGFFKKMNPKQMVARASMNQNIKMAAIAKPKEESD